MATETKSLTHPQTGQSLPLPLQDRVAIFTGSSCGIGKAIAVHLASLGAKVVINYKSNSTQANLLVTQINSQSVFKNNSPQAIAVKADVSDAQVKSLLDAAESVFNAPLYIVVNSAGIQDASYATIEISSLDELDKTFSVNTRCTYLCCKEGAKRIKKGGGGRIICLTSTLTVALTPGTGAYADSKAAIEALVKILAKELKGTRITANCVAPGPIATDMLFNGETEEKINKFINESPLDRLGLPEDVAQLVGFLTSDGGEWVNGQVVRVNGGYI